MTDEPDYSRQADPGARVARNVSDATFAQPTGPPYFVDWSPRLLAEARRADKEALSADPDLVGQPGVIRELGPDEKPDPTTVAHEQTVDLTNDDQQEGS